MAGYWPSSQEKNVANIQLSNQTTLVNKRFVYMAKRLHQRLLRDFCFPARVANQNTGVASSCPLAEPAITQPCATQPVNYYVTVTNQSVIKIMYNAFHSISIYLVDSALSILIRFKKIGKHI